LAPSIIERNVETVLPRLKDPPPEIEEPNTLFPRTDAVQSTKEASWEETAPPVAMDDLLDRDEPAKVDNPETVNSDPIEAELFTNKQPPTKHVEAADIELLEKMPFELRHPGSSKLEPVETRPATKAGPDADNLGPKNPPDETLIPELARRPEEADI
jgi:hypothetical protein